MKISFKAFYYSVTTDDIISKTFEAETLEEAYKIAYKSRPDYCELDFDLYMDTMAVTSATIDDGLGNVKEIH